MYSIKEYELSVHAHNFLTNRGIWPKKKKNLEGHLADSRSRSCEFESHTEHRDYLKNF